MSVAGDEPNSRAPAERHVECYLIARQLRIATVGNRNPLLQVACGDHNLTGRGTASRLSFFAL